MALEISDKLKSCLPAGALNYVLSLEGNDWFDSRRIGELTDTCISNHTIAEKPKHISSAYVASNGSVTQNDYQKWWTIWASFSSSQKPRFQ